MNQTIEEEVGRLLRQRGLTISCAESSTGGLISSLLMNVPGCSAYFRGAVIAYDGETKKKVLGVSAETLERYGSVSAETAREMAEGVRRLIGSHIALSETGIAGPTGGSAERPLGLFYIGLSSRDGTWAEERIFSGSRQENRESTARAALGMAKEFLEKGLGWRPMPLEERQIVTCFLENGGEILLLRRSGEVSVYRGKWASVSGYIEEGVTPYEQALQELREEAGLDPEDIQLVKTGEVVEAVDEELGRKWVVHPFRFHLARREKITLDWEHTELRWIDPKDIGNYRTVPKLAEAWQTVSN